MHFCKKMFLIRFAKEHYDSLEPLFVLDPLLLPNFMQCCPIESYHDLFKVIEPSTALSRIAYLMATSSNLNQVCNQHYLPIA